MATGSNDGKKSEYAERLKRQRKTSAVKFYVLAVVLGSVIGLAYIKRVEIIAAYNSVMNPPPPPTPIPKVEPVEPKIADKVPPVEPTRKNQDVVPTPPKPPTTVTREETISPKDEAKARAFLDEGKASLEAFDFATASKKFDEAATIRIGEALKKEVMAWQKKSVAFQNATKHIAISDYALTDKAVVIETTSGDELRGIKLKDDGETLYFQQVNDTNPAAVGIQKFPIPMSEIKKVKPISITQRKADFSEMILGLESGTSISDSTDYYDLVYLSKRLGLGKECMMYLNRAYDGGPGHAANPDLGDSFRMVVVRHFIGRATLLMTGNRRAQANDELRKLTTMLPGFGPAADEIAAFRLQVMDKVLTGFQPSVGIEIKKNEPKKTVAVAKVDKPKMTKPEREDNVEISTGLVMSTGAAGKILERGNSKFDEGMKVIRTYTLGVGGNKTDNNRILLQAKGQLLEAIDIYEDALKLEPANRAIKDRQQTASQMVYFCNKNLIL
ncbi:MAG: hypothetical protein WCT04_03570 [Planctomycetota bacterium]